MKKIINTTLAPLPIGAYSQAVLKNDILYTSGQIALHPETMKLILDNIEVETEQIMQNLKAILEAANMSFENVIKTTIFIMNMGDFTAVNSIYANYFDQNNAPARETVQVAGLPRGVNVEISMIAAF